MSSLETYTSERLFRAIHERDPAFDGVFVVGVRTTGIFCAPFCPARTPLPENVHYLSGIREAVLAGYRPCKRCRPLAGAKPPAWLASLLEHVERDAGKRWRDRDLAELGLDPIEVREWFTHRHGLTFQAYARVRGVSHAFSGGSSSALFGSPGGDRALVTTLVSTPVGSMVAAAGDEGIYLLEFADRPKLRTQIRLLGSRLQSGFRPGRHRWIDRLEKELEEYFSGSRQNFDVPCVTPGSPFQEAVWAALRRIPYAQTRSYGQIASEAGQPNAVRAVGKTNGDNRISILIPCHRVVGADGALRGYGGGLWRKERLLGLERSSRA